MIWSCGKRRRENVGCVSRSLSLQVGDDTHSLSQIARARVEKATAAAHARQRVTFNPEATSLQQKSSGTQKGKRRVSLGVAVNAETGKVIEGAVGVVGVKRKSQRRHTIMNTSATDNRIKDAQEKRVRGGGELVSASRSLVAYRQQFRRRRRRPLDYRRRTNSLQKHLTPKKETSWSTEITCVLKKRNVLRRAW